VSIQWKIEDGAFVNYRGKAAGLGFDSFGLGRNGYGFAGSGERHLKRDIGYAADIHVQGLAELRRHSLGGNARCVFTGRQEFEGELALAVGGLLIAETSGGVTQSNAGPGDAADGGIEDGSVDGPGGGILREAGHGENDTRKDDNCKSNKSRNDGGTAHGFTPQKK
jgi:hypothetical protein